MDNLHELTQIVNRIKTRRIEIIGKERTKYGKLTKKLYDGIVKGKYKNDREAAIDIYGENFVPNTYTRLKTILTEKLINTLFFIDVSDYNFSPAQHAYVECEKLRTAVKILLSRGAKGAAIKLAEKLIRKSLKYEFTDITLEVGRILRRHFRTYDQKIEKEQVYHEIVEYYYKIISAEIAVENSYELIIKEISKGKKSKEKNALILSKLAIIDSYFPKLESYKLGQFAHLAKIMNQEYLQDYEGIANACKNAIQYFEKKESIFSSVITNKFYNRFLKVCIPLKKIVEGEEIAEKLLTNLEGGSLNWYIALDSYFLLSLHTENYTKAEELYHSAISHKRFRNLSEEFREVWRVYEAYLAYLRMLGKLETEGVKPFRVGKFMNEVPIFSKDKKGVNVAIIIIQVLILIAQDKKWKVIDKVDALRAYVHTHLRNDDSLRSNCFIKMLMQMVKAKFHKAGTIRKTETLYSKLVSTQMVEKSQSQYVEIIPYEQLWAMSLTQLHSRAY